MCLRPGTVLLVLGFALVVSVLAAQPASAQERDHFRQEFNRLKFDKDPALEGNCREGNCRHGRGVVKLENGATFIGHFREGLKDGTAVRIGPDGARYLQVWHMGVKKYDKRMGVLTRQVMNKKKTHRQRASNRRDDRAGKSRHTGTTSLR